MSDEKFLIRLMRSGDVDEVLKIAAGAENIPQWPRSAYLTALDPHAQVRRVAITLVEENADVPLGFAIASVVGEGAEVETIAVETSRQRQGLGRALLERLIGVVRLEGVREVWLEVRVSNVAALQLYRRGGFVENGNRKGYYTDPMEDASVMRLTIS